jgi:mannose-6-phosphate isomerase class I
MDGGSGLEQVFRCPVRDFSLAVASVSADGYNFVADGPEVLLILEGKGEIEGSGVKQGDAFFVLSGEGISVKGEGVRLVRAFVP